MGRYRDVDGDGIPYRTILGNSSPKAAYFNRGSGHNPDAKYSERPEDYTNNVDRLARKFETVRGKVPKPEVKITDGAKIGILCYGTSRYATEESCDQLRDEYGIETSYLRLLAYPFTDEVYDFIDRHERVYVHRSES